MLSIHHIFDTIDMIDKRHLDIRTITCLLYTSPSPRDS